MGEPAKNPAKENPVRNHTEHLAAAEKALDHAANMGGAGAHLPVQLAIASALSSIATVLEEQHAADKQAEADLTATDESTDRDLDGFMAMSKHDLVATIHDVDGRRLHNPRCLEDTRQELVKLRADLAGLARGAQTEQPDTRPTYSALRNWLMEYQRCAVTDLSVEEVETLAVGLAENVPGLARPDNTLSGWAPGTDVTDRVKRGEFPPRGTWIKASDARLGDLRHYRKETGTMWSTGGVSRFPIGPLDGIALTVATPEELAAAGIEATK